MPVPATRSADVPAKLYFMCGKMGAGKTTLARQIAEREGAILIVQDELLATLYPDSSVDIAEFVDRSIRLKAALAPHICALLSRGISIVLDFPANTPRQRGWFRGLFEQALVGHELHFVDASDALCKQQLKGRSSHVPADAPWTTEAEFEAVTAYFRKPAPEEDFNVVRHERG